MTGAALYTAPELEPNGLDVLWLQIGGTLCNLTCRHCFISCHPKNHSFGMMTLADVQGRLRESADWGVKEYYFTGGEPFLNPDAVPILVETLNYGPATVLTNGTVLRDAWLDALAEAERASLYSLEFRVSIDGFSPETNDPIRGEGTFRRAMSGVLKLVEHGFLPLITAARTWPMEQELEVVGRFLDVLKTAGYSRPRLKILPTLHLGAEVQRSHGYQADERVTADMLVGFDLNQLVCRSSRTATDRGVHVCPILIESPDSLLGGSLSDSLRPFPLSHGACYTCFQYGALCSNPSSGLSNKRV